MTDKAKKTDEIPGWVQAAFPLLAMGIPALALWGCVEGVVSLVGPLPIQDDNKNIVHAFNSQKTGAFVLHRDPVSGEYRGFKQEQKKKFTHEDGLDLIAAVAGVTLSDRTGANLDQTTIAKRYSVGCPDGVAQEFFMCSNGMWTAMSDTETAQKVSDVLALVDQEDPSKSLDAKIPDNAVAAPDRKTIFINFVDGRWLDKNHTAYSISDGRNHLNTRYTLDGKEVHKEFLTGAKDYFTSPYAKISSLEGAGQYQPK